MTTVTIQSLLTIYSCVANDNYIQSDLEMCHNGAIETCMYTGN